MPDFDLEEEDTGTAFNEEEFADPEADAEMEANEQATASALEAMTTEEPAQQYAEEDEASYMGEVERRLDVASYYRELLASPIFENGDDNAQIVEAEIRRFATGRMQVLMGLKKEGSGPDLPPPPAKPLFAEAEVQALKGLARLAPLLIKQLQALDARNVEVLQEVVASVLKQRANAAARETHTRPTIRTKPSPAAAAPAPAPKPAPPAPAPKPPAPKPAPARPTPPPAKPAPRPAARPTLARRGGKPARAPAPVAAAPAPPAAPVGPPAAEAPPNDGRMHQVRPRNHNVRPTGPVPFPQGKEAMEAATASFAAVQARSIARAADGPEKATDFVGIS